MYICICKNIKHEDIARDPGLIHLVGTQCGMCSDLCTVCGKTDCEHILDIALIKEVAKLKIEGVI